MNVNMPIDSVSAITLDVVNRFNDAIEQHDVVAVMALMTDDCVFENTSPMPNGERFEGQAAVGGFWARFFQESPNAHFETQDMFAAGDRCTVCWLYRWGVDGDTPGHIRGVDVFRVRDGLVAEKLSYVKG